MKGPAGFPTAKLPPNGRPLKIEASHQTGSRNNIKPKSSSGRLESNSMADTPSDDNSVLLVHAYLDGELDAANALAIAQRMSTEPALAAEGERVKALQRLIHERLPREPAPPGLHARIEASIGGVRRSRAQPSWRALAASIVLTAVVASSSTWFIAALRTGKHGSGHPCFRPHPRAHGAAADRRGVVGPPYRKAVVQWPHPGISAGCRPR